MLLCPGEQWTNSSRRVAISRTTTKNSNNNNSNDDDIGMESLLKHKHQQPECQNENRLIYWMARGSDKQNWRNKKNSWSYLWALAPVRTCAVCEPCQWYQHRSRIPTRYSAIILICWRARGCDDSMTRLTHHQFNSCNAIHSAQVAGSSISSNHHVSIDWLHGDARPSTESCTFTNHCVLLVLRLPQASYFLILNSLRRK